MDNYWKLKEESDKQLAHRLDKAGAAVANDMKETLLTIGEGFDRSLKLLVAPYFENYKDVYYETLYEDRRFARQVAKLTTADTTHKLVQLFISSLLEHKDDETIKKLAAYITRIGSTYSSGYVTKSSLAISIASIFTTKHSSKIFKTSKGVANIALTIFQVYGYFEKASRATNRLKRIYPHYYHALYINDMDMLYFLVEPNLGPIVTKIVTTGQNLTYKDLVEIVNMLIF